MARSKVFERGDPLYEVARSFAVNEQINQVLLEHIEPAAWEAKIPGARTRTIAGIFSHMHNVRRKWLRLSAPHLKSPAALSRTCTQHQARTSLATSAARCIEMIEEALSSTSGRVPEFLRDGWAHPWPAGPMMVAYMITHEAHHRGQICMLARQLGFPLAGGAISAMWNWEKLFKLPAKR